MFEHYTGNKKEYQYEMQNSGRCVKMIKCR